MEHLLLIGCISLAVFSCKDKEQSEPMVAGATSQADTTTYAYKAGYSSDIEMGDHQNAKKVLEIYKDYDSGNLLAHKDWFADTVTFDLSNGQRCMELKTACWPWRKEKESNFNQLPTTLMFLCLPTLKIKSAIG